MTALQDSTPAVSNSSKASKDTFVMFIKTLAYGLGELLASSPEPDVYGTLNQIFAEWHKGKRNMTICGMN